MKILRFLTSLFLLAATAFGQVSMLQVPAPTYTDKGVARRTGTYNKYENTLVLITDTNGITVPGVIVVGTGPTTLTDVSGKILSAALNTVAAAQGGFGADVSASSGVPLFAAGVNTFTATTGTGTFVRSISPTLTGTIGAASLSLSSLTSGRVPFATTAGLFTDSTSLTFNSGTGALTATSFVGAFTGTATNATNIGITDDVATNASMFPLWVTANTGNLPAKVSSTKLFFNPSTGLLTAPSLTLTATTSLLLGTSGSLVGNIGFRNATSGTATLAPPTGALSTYTVTLPNAASTLPIFGQQITFAGPTAARTITLLDLAYTTARQDAAQTFTGVQSFTSPDFTTSVTTPSTSFTAWAGATTLLTFGGTGASASTFMPSTLDATTSTTGAIRTSGGISAAKAGNIGTTLTAGTSVVSPIFSSNNADPADSGVIRLGNAELIAWEASPASTDVTLTVNSSEQFVFSNDILSPSLATSLLTSSSTFALLNATATTVNAFGAATTVNTGASATQIWNFGGSTTASEFRFLEPSGSGTNYSAFKAVAQSANITYSLPPTVSAAGGALTDVAGNGVLTWVVPTGTGTVTVVGAGALTSTALVTGGGTTTLQTPSATATMDSSGNISTPGTLTVGNAATTAGAIALTQGTTQSTGTTNITLQAPTSVTSYLRTLEGTAGSTGVYIGTTSGTTVTDSRVAPSTSGNVLTSNGTTWTSAAAAGGTAANPTGTVGLTTVNGSASTYLRSDGAPPLSQAIAPTWTGVHTFTPTARSSGVASYFVVTTPADTAQTASTESIGASFTAATRQWSTGALTTQRERVFAAPTYGFVGASTLTTAVNVDIADPIAGTNATLTNKYGLRVNNQQVTGTLTANTGTNLIGPLVDSVDGTTPLNNILTTIAAGTAYTLTASNADVAFGTTSPTVTLANAGTYMLVATIQTSLVGATYAAAFQTVSYNFRRTNNTAADLSGSTFLATLNMVALTTQTIPGPVITINLGKYVTTNTTDVIGLRGVVSATPAAGSVTCSNATITAIRLY